MPKDYAVYPVLRESAYEIDQLLQEITTAIDDYSIVVYEMSEEEAAELMVSKLKGY